MRKKLKNKGSACNGFQKKRAEALFLVFKKLSKFLIVTNVDLTAVAVIKVEIEVTA